MTDKMPHRKTSRTAAKLRLFVLALAIFVGTLQPQPAHAQFGTCLGGICAGGIEQMIMDGIQKILSSVGNILQPLVAKIQSMANDVRSTYQADRATQDSENQLQAKAAADAQLPVDANGNSLTTTCANLTIHWVSEGAASAVRGLHTRLGGIEATRGTGQNGQEQTPAAAAEKGCALSGQGWTFVNATRNGYVPKPCPSQ